MKWVSKQSGSFLSYRRRESYLVFTDDPPDQLPIPRLPSGTLRPPARPTRIISTRDIPPLSGQAACQTRLESIGERSSSSGADLVANNVSRIDHARLLSGLCNLLRNQVCRVCFVYDVAEERLVRERITFSEIQKMSRRRRRRLRGDSRSARL